MVDFLEFLKGYSYDYTYLKSILLHFDEDEEVVLRELIGAVAVGDIEVGIEKDVGTPRRNRLQNQWELSKEDATAEVFTYNKG